MDRSMNMDDAKNTRERIAPDERDVANGMLIVGEKAEDERLQRLKGTRKGMCGHVTRKTNQIRSLMVAEENAEQVKAKLLEWEEAYKHFTDSNNAYSSELSVEERDKDQNWWYSPKDGSFREFREQVKRWLYDALVQAYYNPRQSEIGPDDSISQVGSNMSRRSMKSRSVLSGKDSLSSSASSARMKEEAKKAELVARATMLKKKQALEQEEHQLRQKKEEFDLQAELAVTDAKTRVYEQFEASESRGLHYGDGMNQYFLESKQSHPATTFTKPVLQPISTRKIASMADSKQYHQGLTLDPHAEEYAPATQGGYNEPNHAQRPQSLHRDIDQVRFVNNDGGSGHSSERTFRELLQQQNDITRLLIEQHQKSTLPPREIPTFDGDPLKYRSFIRAFEHGIEDKTKSHRDRIYYLEQFTSGEPNDLVSSCTHMDPDVGYEHAKKLLKKKYGDDYKIAMAYIDKAMNWPSIKSEDSSALDSYSVFLTGCHNTMDDIDYMKEMDHPKNLKAVVSKFPFKLRERWRGVAHKIMEKQRRIVKFGDLTDFVEEQVRIITNPLFGNITEDTKDRSYIQARTSMNQKSSKTAKPNSFSFATTVTSSRHADREDGNLSSSENEMTPVSQLETEETFVFTHNQAPGSDTLSSSTSSAFNKPCLFCKGEHTLEMCKRLRNKPHGEKIRFLRPRGFCFSCLVPGHISRDCNRKLNCKVCQQPHATVLHFSKEETDNQEVRNNCVSTSKGNCGHTKAVSYKGTMAIIPVRIKAKNSDKFVETYAFLDNGSSATFCTDWLMRKLNAQGRQTKILLHTMGQTKLVESNVIRGLEVCSLDSNHTTELPDVYTQKEMPVAKEDIPRQEDIDQWPYLKDVRLPQIDAGIGLLIGNNVPRAVEPWQVINSREDGPYAMRTLLGWAVNGPLRNHDKITGDDGNGARILVNKTSIISNTEQQLTNLFNHDFTERTIDDKPEDSREDCMFIESVKRTVELKDGHYQIGLPFRNQNVQMPNNRSQAEQRATQLKRKLKRNTKFYEDYKAFVGNILTKGYAQKVPRHQLDRDDGKVWYLPHHGIYHPKKPEKIRVVYDCSARFQGTSLNDQLLQGPDLTSTLVGVLTRFRQESVALMADVEAMFYQTRVSPADYDVLRFLWWPEGNLDEELAEYRMVVHIFGAVSSPSCSNFALKKTAEDNEDSFDEEIINTIRKNFYVDDCLKSLPTDRKAADLARDLTTACARGGFHLTKWISNSRAVLESIAEKERAKEVKDLDLDQDTLPMERALGVQWCVESDKFKFRILIRDRPPTRRGILSIISSVYDPLGFVAPFILLAKIILQDLCRLKYGWDDDIKQKHLDRWQRWLADLPKLADFAVDRCLKPTDLRELKWVQIHHFSDASESGYGSVAYLRLINQEGRPHCSFLIGKSRVAPLKQVTIPRMELTAATVSVRLNKMMGKELEIPIDQKIFWTDSMPVLRYIENETARFHTFVANRIAVIREGSEPSEWRYVETESNPADDASRGVWADALSTTSNWINGPDFLWKPDVEWTKRPENPTKFPTDDPEVKQDVTMSTVVVRESVNTTNKLISHFSNWIALKKSVSWILKVKGILRRLCKRRKEVREEISKAETNQTQKRVLESKRMQKEKENIEPKIVTVRDLRKAEHAILSFVQHQSFPDEINALKESNRGSTAKDGMSQRRQNVKRSSPIYRLDPLLEDGLLKVGGRLSHAAMSEEAKHPIILPKDAHVSWLIIRQIHEDVGHAGRNHVLSRLWQNYWILKGNSAVRGLISKCVICRRQRAKVGEQKMADLPADRLIPDEPPFTRVGVDYFGPIEVKRGRSVVKRYGAIFTCLAIRAIHIEIAHSLDTNSFISALRRFISRRGQVQEIRSDNGTNFVGGERELKAEISKWNHSKIREAMLQKNVDWIFNPPAGSHHGGVWERQIRTVRKILRTLLKEQMLDDENLLTLMCEVEAIVNSRPITKVSSDPNDLEALTPNHLLLLKTKPNLPPGLFNKEDQYVRRRWRQVQYMADLFWKRWVREYLPLLQERQKWVHPRRNFAVGDVVLIVDAKAPRNSWPMGRILKVMPDKKGFIRRVEVKTRTAVLERPIDKLCILLESGVIFG